MSTDPSIVRGIVAILKQERAKNVIDLDDARRKIRDIAKRESIPGLQHRISELDEMIAWVESHG